jgi:hypothetical protein
VWPPKISGVLLSAVGPAVLPVGSHADPGTAEAPPVVFLSDTEAQLPAVWISGTTKQELVTSVLPPPDAPPGMIGALIRFTLTTDGWKVSRASFCRALVGVVACPTGL